MRSLIPFLVVLLGLAGTRAGALDLPGFRKADAYRDAAVFQNNGTGLSITDGLDGTIYVGTSLGIATFDGRVWTPLEIPGVRDVMGMATDLDGRVLVGTFDHFGYLEPAADGRVQFVSVRHLFPPAFAGASTFFQPVVGRNGVFFMSFNAVFRWDRGQRVQGWPVNDFFPYLISAGEEVLISDGGRGLFRVRGDALEIIPGSEPRSAAERSNGDKVTASIPYRQGWLLVTQSDGLRFYDGQRVSALELRGSDALRRAGVTTGMYALHHGRFLTHDEAGNVLVFDGTGAIVSRWANNAYPGFATNGAFVDRAGNVWLTNNSGLLRIDLDAEVRVFDERANWSFLPRQVVAHGERRIFITDAQSTEWVPGADEASGEVRPIREGFAVAGSFDGDLMLVPARDGDVVVRYADGREERVLEQSNWRLHASPRDRRLVYANYEPSTLKRLRKTGGRWTVDAETVLPLRIADMTEGQAHLWFKIGQGRVARADREPFAANFKVFDAQHGLPGHWIRAFNFGAEVLFTTAGGIYFFDDATQRFRPDPRFAAAPRNLVRDAAALETDADQNIWISSPAGSGILRRRSDGTYRWDAGALSSLGDAQFQKMQWDQGGWMWCRAMQSLVTLKADAGRHDNVVFAVRVGEIRDLQSGEVLFGGFRPAGAPPPVLRYARNSLQFQLVAPEFSAPGAVEFQTWLEGRDDTWSEWTRTSAPRYAGLSEGRYTLHYRARNAHGRTTEGRAFVFAIEPPPYRTVLAYLGYAAGLTLVITGGVQVYSRRLRRRNARLEALVAERTRDVEAAHRELVDASHRAGMAEVATSVLHNVGNVLNSVNVSASLIADQTRRRDNAKLERLIALFRSHEHDLCGFLAQEGKARQVATFLEELAKQARGDRDQLLEEAALLQRNVEHIKEIVSTQQAYATTVAVVEPLEPATLMLDALKMNADSLHRHGVQVVKEFPVVPRVLAQRGKMLQILVNLIRNAKQACEQHAGTAGVVTLRLSTGPADRVNFIVQDNGVGIAPENLTRIFQHGFTTRKGGHGFGLHSSANAAAEMKGALRVHSDGLGCGATFTLELPVAEASVGAPLV